MDEKHVLLTSDFIMETNRTCMRIILKNKNHGWEFTFVLQAQDGKVTNKWSEIISHELFNSMNMLNVCIEHLAFHN